MDMIYPEGHESRYNLFYQQERSITLLLLAAMKRLDDDNDFIVHSRFAGGLYCTALKKSLNGTHRAEIDLPAIEQEMHRIIAENHPIEPIVWNWSKAVSCLQERGWTGAVRLLEQSGAENVRLWRLNGCEAWFPGEMDQDLAHISTFALEPFAEGFVLRLPDRKNPDTLAPFVPSEKLFATLMQTKDWGMRTRSYDIGTLNLQIENDATGLILTSEALHEQHLTDVTRSIVLGMPETRIVLIAGPSSSGKTTFSRRLMIQLRAQAIHSTPIQMDDYFKNRPECPKDEFGNYDFEHFDCLNREMLTEDVSRLLKGETIVLPEFDFINGQSQRGSKSVHLRDNEVLILEGIHGLNPSLMPEINTGNLVRIFVSALTNLNIDRHSRIPTSDIRLVRRLVRDYRTRGHTPQSTYGRWDSVRAGEDRWIFPYQDNADILFNTALPYEIGCLKTPALHLMGMTQFTDAAAGHAERIQTMLDLVRPIDARAIPLHSVIREFIGGSVWE